jgi:2,4-dienoyl-CoA reductase-like NADH-dependent reductase (Old Yellow Enzyme family)/thioredoxin reductase
VHFIYEQVLSEQVIAYYTEFAKGGCAIITPGVVCVDYPYGKPEKLIIRMDNPKNVKDMCRMAERIHRYGAMLIPQIHHAGGQTDHICTDGNLPRCVSDRDVEHVYLQPHRLLGPQQELTTTEVKALVQKFIQAAINCQKAKCDGVTLHGAHGYLINQFLSPSINARTDEYGGSIDNRVRFGVEVIQGIRAACGPGFVIGARIPGHEWVSNGLTDEECVEIARRFEAAGCDYLDISGGATNILTSLMETDKYEQGDRVHFATRVKQAVSIPVGAVGKLRDPDFCEAVIAEGKADFVSMGRTLICDPYWPEKARRGTPEQIRPCLSCFDGCTNRLFDGCPVGCALNPRTGREFEIGYVPKAETPRNVVVIGGGLAGMQAAITAASIGHKVTLFEKENTLGGQLNLACVPPHKGAIKKAQDWFTGELQRQNVTVRLGTRVTAEMITGIKPAAIIAATGAVPVGKIPVSGLEHTVQAWDVLSGKAAVPANKNVAIIGGGIVGCEVALMLLQNGNKVAILEMLPSIANGLEMLHTSDLLTEFAAKGVNILTGAQVTEITKDSVHYKQDGKSGSVASGITILAVGQKSEGGELIEALRQADYDVTIIGDALRPAKFIDAVREGYFAGLNIT